MYILKTSINIVNTRIKKKLENMIDGNFDKRQDNPSSTL